VQLQSERAGVVKEILFEEGQLAKAGDVLLTIDDSDLQAQLARAKAQLEVATAMEARQRNLLENRGISAADFDQSRANLDIAKAEVKLIETQVAKAKIRAPFDGIAGLRHASVGTYLTPGSTICTFQDISSLKIDFSLPERYLGFIKPGQTVHFRVTGRAERFEAQILAIEPVVDVQTRSITIRATLPNENTRLLPGSFAEVEVVLNEVPDAILIPSIALMPGVQQQTVFVHEAGQVALRKVQVGLRTADSVQILEGLKVGEELITSGILQLRAGMRVQVKQAAVKARPELSALPAPAESTP
jgi:membrane fusion protein, multidrug efflux system